MRIRTVGLLGGLAAGLAAAVHLARRFEVPSFHGPKSDHFDGTRFFNPCGEQHGIAEFFQWIRTRRPGYWPRWTDVPPGEKPLSQFVDDGVRVTLVNHSTVLIQTEGMNLLTDPVWSERVSPVSWAGPRRRRAPGIRFADLPPIDLVLISHNHYDHLDLATLKRIQKRDAPRILCGLGNSAFLEREGIRGSGDLDWWEKSRAGVLEVTAVPARHFSSRSIADRDRALWTGFVVQGRSASVYFAGDTGWGDHFAAIAERFPGIDLALRPIGAYLPRWFMSPVHMSPQEAVRAHEALGARHSMPIHHSTFPLGDDGEKEAVNELTEAIAAAGLGTSFLIPPFGDAVELSPP